MRSELSTSPATMESASTKSAKNSQGPKRSANALWINDGGGRFTEVARPGTEDERVRFSELSDTGGVVNLYNAVQLAQQRAGRGN